MQKSRKTFFFSCFVSALESKENAPERMLEDLVKKEKYKSLKKKIAHVKSECLTPVCKRQGKSKKLEIEFQYNNTFKHTINPLPPSDAAWKEKNLF